MRLGTVPRALRRARDAQREQECCDIQRGDHGVRRCHADERYAGGAGERAGDLCGVVGGARDAERAEEHVGAHGLRDQRLPHHHVRGPDQAGHRHYGEHMPWHQRAAHGQR